LFLRLGGFAFNPSKIIKKKQNKQWKTI